VNQYIDGYGEGASAVNGRGKDRLENDNPGDASGNRRSPSSRKMFRGDAAQMELTMLIRVHYEELFGDYATNVSTEIVQLQKIGNVLYIQLLTTVHNAHVDGKVASVSFVREEAMFISMDSHLRP
jgi:hypothetical protein